MPYKNIEQQKAAQRRYYEQNRERLLAVSTNKRSLFRRYIQEVKSQSPCADCGLQYPYYVMQFDHCRGTKSGDVSKLGNFGTLDALKEEIAKCEVVCANCHAHRSFMRLGSANHIGEWPSLEN